MSRYDEPQQGERITVYVDSDLKEIIPGFILDWRQDIESMREALEKKQYETISKLGHDMKGTGGACGFDVVTDVGMGLESAAKDLNTDAIRRHLDTLSSYLELVDVVYVNSR